MNITFPIVFSNVFDPSLKQSRQIMRVRLNRSISANNHQNTDQTETHTNLQQDARAGTQHYQDTGLIYKSGSMRLSDIRIMDMDFRSEDALISEMDRQE
jgi:hypothetical protein